MAYTQPIELRVQEISADARLDVAIKLYGDDLDAAVSQVRARVHTKTEQIAGLPYLRIRIDRAQIARYNINAFGHGRLGGR